MKKRFLSILLSVMMVLSIVASSGITFAAEYNDEGKISLANATITVPNDNGNGGSNAIDGNTGTMWHSVENTNPPAELTEDNEIIITLNESVQVDKLRYLPRQDAAEHGKILGYEIYYSNTADQEDFQLVASGAWDDDKEWKEATFEAVTAQRIKLVAKTTSASIYQAANKFITAAEIELYDTTKAQTPPAEVVDPDNPDASSQTGVNTTYEIYPTVQQFVYYEEVTTIPEAVDVVFTGDIDNAIKNHLASTLALVGTTGTEVSAVGDNFTVVASVYDPENDNSGITLTSEDFFNNYDAYILKIEENKIIILGKDTDAVYYGIPYSNEDIMSLMEFGSDFKMNTFIYAPKDDPYHNAKWREPYPQETIDGLKEVIQKGVETKVGFVYAIHPFMNNGINKNDFDREIKYITDKFQVFYDLGVRQFALLADDAWSETPLQVMTVNALQDWLDTKEGTYPLVFCPQAYSGYPSESYFNQFRDGTSIEINGGMSFSTVNERTIKTDAVQKEGYEAYNMVDGKLDTYFASGTESGYIEYTINKEVGLNPFTFTVIQNSETISNAKVEVKVYGTDEYVELGTLDKSICDFTLDPQTQVVRISWDAGEEFFIHEMFY